MKKISKIITFVITFCMLIMTILEPAVVKADVPYRTFTQNGYGELVETQTSYTPYKTLVKIGGDTLSGPEDIKITADGLIYIADTVNKRIVVADLEGNLIKEIGKDVLVRPRGVFITDEGLVYVADSGDDSIEGSIVVFDQSGKEIMRYGKPNSPLYGNMGYKPKKISVNDGGTMYIVSDGNTNGIIQLSPTDGGTFLGYFGTNASLISVSQIFQKFLYGEKTTGMTIIPTSVENVAIDQKNLLYTVTVGSNEPQPVKKLNVSGTNMMLTDLAPSDSTGVCVGAYDNVFVSTGSGYIYEYNKEGSLLFVFGGKDSYEFRVGLFNTISAIAVDSADKLYVLDSVNNEIQIFKPTEFTDLVHESLVLYQQGLYQKSKEPLAEIIKMNSLFDYANLAMGQSNYQEGNFDEAMDYFRAAKDAEGYSNSFWEVRNVWLRKNIVALAVVIITLFVLYKVLKYGDKKAGLFNPIRKATAKLRSKIFIKRMSFGKYYMRHPIDGAYEIKRQGMQSYLTTFLLTVVFLIIYVINKYFCGFIVKNVKDGRYEIPTDIMVVFAVLIAMSAVTYLICAINDGEGTFKNIISSYVYALTPYLFIQPLLYILGRIVTYNEIFIMEFGNILMLVWIVILLFMSIKEINNYSVGETFKVIGLTLFATFIFALIAFIMYVLVAQVWDFISSIYREVVYKIVGV